MNAVIRNYSGPGASALVDLLEGRKSEIEDLIRSVDGFVRWFLVRTEGGCATVTVCESKAGTDQSLQMASDWIAENAGDLGVILPDVTEGEIVLQVA